MLYYPQVTNTVLIIQLGLFPFFLPTNTPCFTSISHESLPLISASKVDGQLQDVDLELGTQNYKAIQGKVC